MSVFGGASEVVGRVVTKYEADTKDHIAELKKLRGEQRKQAQEALDSLEKQNKAWGDWKVKAGLAFAGVAASFGIARAGFQAFSDDVKLRAGAATVSIDALRAASAGLIKDQNLLRIAQAGAQGVWKLHTANLEEVTEAMVRLRKAGHDEQEVLDTFLETLRKGETDELKKFGLSIKKGADATETWANLLAGLRKDVPKLGDDLTALGDEAVQAAIRAENAWRDVKVAIGSAIADYIDYAKGVDPELVEENAKRERRIREVMKLTGNDYEASRRQLFIEDIQYNQLRSGNYQFAGGAAHVASNIQNVMEGSFLRKDEFIIQLNKALANEIWKAYSEGAATGIDGPSWIAGQFGSMLDRGRRAKWGKQPRRGTGRGEGGTGSDDPYSLWDRVTAGIDRFALLADRYEGPDGEEAAWLARSRAMQRDSGRLAGMADADTALLRLEDSIRRGREMNDSQAQREGLLASVFGPVSEFELYAKGFQMLEGTVASAFDSWITGAKGVGEAMREAVAGFAKSLATEALMQALRHGAYALGSLAFGDVRGASAHGLTAAKWAGVAVVAGAAAKGLGGGSGVGGLSGGAYRASGSSGGGDSPRVVNVVLGGGSGGLDESPRSNARRVARALFMADQMGYSGAPPGVSFE